MIFENDDIIYVVLGMLGIIIALFAIFSGQYVHLIAELKVDKEVGKAKAELKAILQFADAIKIYKKDVEAAITLSEKALPHLTGVELIQAKSNLAYYYAYGFYPESKNRAISLAYETLSMVFIHPDRANNFKINYGYVIMRYANNHEEIQRAIKFLSKLLERKSLDEEDITEINDYISEANEKKSKL